MKIPDLQVHGKSFNDARYANTPKDREALLPATPLTQIPEVPPEDAGSRKQLSLLLIRAFSDTPLPRIKTGITR
jgi:hypothetical protein